jgi:CMP-N,N'-diacetyllegionaminic acid synthase
MCKFIKIENTKKKIDGKLIALIPARKGSKSIKNKNLYKINGVPLISFTIIAAKKTKLINDIYVSSDSEEILNFSKKQKVLPLKRPKKYSMDNSSANEVVKHFISNTKIKKMIL